MGDVDRAITDYGKALKLNPNNANAHQRLGYLLYHFHTIFSPFNVFRYITVRAALAVVTAALIVLVLGPRVISWLSRISVTQQIRDDGPHTHLSKKGTPTMGGMLMHIRIFVAVLLWGDLTNRYIWVLLVATGGFALIGFIDDYRKVVLQNPKGLRAKHKFGAQVALSLGIALFLYLSPSDPYSSKLIVPFFKNLIIDLGWFSIPFAVLVVVGSSNAVNLTDGIDGLAAGLVAIAVLANSILVYIAGHAGLAKGGVLEAEQDAALRLQLHHLREEKRVITRLTALLLIFIPPVLAAAASLQRG